MMQFQKKHNPAAILVEYNGMWQIADLYNALTDDWFVYQKIFLADYTAPKE